MKTFAKLLLSVVASFGLMSAVYAANLQNSNTTQANQTRAQLAKKQRATAKKATRLSRKAARKNRRVARKARNAKLANTVIAANAAKVNLNTATLAQLEKIKGIGPAKAKAIIAYRSARGGSFSNLKELTRIKGINRGLIAKIQNQVTLG